MSYPVSLPVWLIEGHGFEAVPMTHDTRPERGEDRVRQVYRTAKQIATVSALYTQAQYDVWSEYYEETLEAGAMSFAAPLKSQTANDLTWWTVRIIDPPNEEVLHRDGAGQNRYRLSMRLFMIAPAVPPAACLEPDPHIEGVILLLRGQGTDGGTTITDSSDPTPPLQGGWNPPDSVTGVTTSSAQALECFGETSLLFAPSGQPGLRYSSTNALAWLGNVIAAGGYTSWTIDAWVYQSSSVGMGLISYRPPAAIGWAVTTSGFRAHIGGVWSDTWIAVSAPAANTWTHVQMERDGSAWRYFTDGALVGSFTNAAGITNNAAQVAVGHASTDNTEQQFRGHMYLRFTAGVARSGGVNFTPPNNFPAI